MTIKRPNRFFGRGAYSAIVFIDGDYTVAEDDVGTLISEETDAATVINAALAELPQQGGLIQLKDRFIINTTITVDTEGVIIQGESWKNSGLTTTENIPLITVTPDACKTVFEKMFLQGANDVAKTSNHGIYFSGSTVKYDIQLRDIYIHETYDGLNGFKVAYMNIDNLRCLKCKHDGIHLTADISDYSTLLGTHIYLKEYGNYGCYFTYLMGSKLVNLWLEGNSVGVRGLHIDHGFMNWFTNVDCENNTGHGAVIQNDGFGSSFTGCWFSGNGDVGFWAYYSQELSLVQCYFAENDHAGFLSTNSVRLALNACYGVENSRGVGSYDGFALDNSTDNILNACHAYDNQGTKTQVYGIKEYGTSNYNTYTNNNLRGNLTGAKSLLGANNIDDNNMV